MREFSSLSDLVDGLTAFLVRYWGSGYKVCTLLHHIIKFSC